MIKVLDSFVADKIAAGEVIERPVSAVKELVENSIDAGADSIIVEIRGGGKSYMRVTDNGCGIPYDEAETAFLRHATSKISGISDLDCISSLGFRGEALASIAAVSRLTVVTRTHDSASGIRLVMHGGKTISRERTGANPGTSMIAEDLFYNTPARRKFMRSDAREASAVIELVQQFAVCYAGIRFMMISNGQTLFTTAGDGDVLAVIRSLYPDLAGIELIPLAGERIRGYVSDPGAARTSRKGQLFFVNGRLVSSQLIEKGLEDGYCGRIFSGFPVAVLFIDADPGEIDVNIHPGKREIRFLRQDDVRSAVADAVKQAVMTDAGVVKGFVRDDTAAQSTDNGIKAAVSTAACRETAYDGSELMEAAFESAPEAQTSIKDFLMSLERPAASDNASAASAAAEEYSEYRTYTTAADEAAPDVSAAAAAAVSAKKPEHDIYRPFEFEDLTLKGYVFNTYIIMESRGALYIFDQHAAHERVFYEKFMAGYRSSSHLPQPILTAFTISVSADVYCMERGWLDDLRAMGYDIEDFGERTFIVRGIPPYMTAGEADGFLRGYIDGLDDANGINNVVIDKLIMRSCKSAVKANDRLSETEITELMKSLAACENPFSCPHGRPTFIKITEYDIERSFRRK